MTSVRPVESPLPEPADTDAARRRQTDAYRTQLERLCCTHPGLLTQHLTRLADRWDRKGTPPKQLKLAVSPLPQAEMVALGCCFNNALRTTPHGVHLDVEKFLAPLSVPCWRDALCAVLGRKPRHHEAEKQAYGRACADLLERWCERFPTLAPARVVLADALPKRLPATGLDALASIERTWDALGQAAVAILATPDIIGISDVGARFFADSKAVRGGTQRRLLAKVLGTADGSSPDDLDPDAILHRYGVCDNATALKVTVFGPFGYRKRGRWFDWIADLHAAGESATLSLDNLQDIECLESVASAPAGIVTTTENETPFCGLIRERFPGCLVYTAGYPNPAVRRLLGLLPPDWTIRHWGDSDLDGLRIAAILGRNRPVHLWRCDLETLRRHREYLIELRSEDIARASDWLQRHPDFVWARELAFTIANGWLEQEAWRPANNTV